MTQDQTRNNDTNHSCIQKILQKYENGFDIAYYIDIYHTN